MTSIFCYPAECHYMEPHTRKDHCLECKHLKSKHNEDGCSVFSCACKAHI